MFQTFAAQTAASTCPRDLPGCAAHLPTIGGGPVHISAEHRIPLGEGHVAYVSREQAPGQPPAVRMQGAGDTPMLPAQALQLGVAVIFEAFEAQAWSRWNVPQCTSECDDLSGPGAPTGKDRGWHHDDCPWGSLLWAADLVRQVTR